MIQDSSTVLPIRRTQGSPLPPFAEDNRINYTPPESFENRASYNSVDSRGVVENLWKIAGLKWNY
jgi:hypothetical protein